MKLLLIILLISGKGFSQADSIQLSVGNIKNVTGFSLEYSKDAKAWSNLKTINTVKDTGVYKLPVSPLVYGFYRVKVLGVTEASVIVNFFNPLPVTLTNWTLRSIGNYDILGWRSQNESNIKKYLISRSTDGVHFNYLQEVTAKGNSDYKITIRK